jgi:hypothetical protein
MAPSVFFVNTNMTRGTAELLNAALGSELQGIALSDLRVRKYLLSAILRN